jgi:NADPH:quinone reductase-like Zn-dependent oxidoreductase
MMKRQRIIGSTIRARSEELKKIVMRDLYKKVWPFIESNEIKPIIHEVFNISETEKAHQIMENNENIGKIVLALD